MGPGTEDEELRRTAIGSAGPPIRALGTDQMGEIPELEVEPDPESLTETSGEYLDPTILDDGRFGPTDPMAPMFEDAGATLVKTTVADPPMPAPRAGRDSRGPRSRRFSEVQFVPRPPVSPEVPALHHRVLFWKKLSLGATALAIVAAAVAVAVVVVSKRNESAEPAKPAATAAAATDRPVAKPATAKAAAPGRDRAAAVTPATPAPAEDAHGASTAPAAGAAPTTPAVTLVVESPAAAEKSDEPEPEAETETETETAPARNKPARSAAAKPTPAAARVTARQRARAAYEQGVRQFMDGSLQSAERSFRKALKLDPGHAAAYKGLGLVFRRSGQKRRAINELRAYLRAAPNARDAAQIRKLIRGLDG